MTKMRDALLVLLLAACAGAERAATGAKARGRPTACDKAVSVYAMQKTGSTFLGRVLQDVSQRYRMCQVYQNTKEFACSTKLYVDCPRNSMHRKSVSLNRAFSPSAQWRRQGQLGCGSEHRRQVFTRANGWLP